MSNNYKTDCTSVRNYFNKLTDTIGEENALYLLSGKEISKRTNGPFLSVVMRTQGNRPLALRESLLCLSAQTNTDFEVLIMGHNLTIEGETTINKIIDECSDWLKEKIRLVKVTGGNRTTPLDMGFAEAKGTYISIYDDDDLIFDNWVETFYNLYEQNPGTVLHAYSVAQKWKLIKNEKQKFLVASSPFENIFCKDFSLIEQLSQNFCPTMSLAFPAFAYKNCNIHFDQTLTTTEDWDFLMRTVFICGISDSHNVTSIYRKWENTKNSQTEHDESQWSNNHHLIQNKFLKFTIPLEIDSIKSLMYSTSGKLSNSNLFKTELYIDSGNGFEGSKLPETQFEFKSTKTCLELKNCSDYNNIRKIRFDPDFYGLISVRKFNCEIKDLNNKDVSYKIEFLRSNYVKYKDYYVFCEDDPQLVLKLKSPCDCSEINFNYTLNKQIPPKMMLISILKYSFCRVIRKTARFCFHFFERIKHLKIYSIINAMRYTSEELFETNTIKSEIYIDTGKGFEENKLPETESELKSDKTCLEIKDCSKYKNVYKIRFDPDNSGLISVNNFNCEVKDVNNNDVLYKTEFLRSNYVKYKESYIFFENDPKIIFKLNTPCECSKIKFSYTLSKHMPPKMVFIVILKSFLWAIIKKPTRLCFHIFKKIKH